MVYISNFDDQVRNFTVSPNGKRERNKASQEIKSRLGRGTKEAEAEARCILRRTDKQTHPVDNNKNLAKPGVLCALR